MGKYDVHSTYRNIGSQMLHSIGDHKFISDEPVIYKGTDAGPNPVEYLLSSLAGCLGASAASIDHKNKDLKIEMFNVDVSGETKTFSDGSSKVTNIHIKIDCKTNLSKPDQEKFIQDVIHICTVHSTLENAVDMDIEVN